MQGKVKWFDNKKGYGYITGEDGKDYFVHHSNIEKGRTYVGFKQKKKGNQAVAVNMTNADE